MERRPDFSLVAMSCIATLQRHRHSLMCISQGNLPLISLKPRRSHFVCGSKKKAYHNELSVIQNMDVEQF